jgi:hypothetical protein
MGHNLWNTLVYIINKGGNRMKHQHTFVDTGMRTSWCSKCNWNAQWDSETFEFVPVDNKLTCYPKEEEKPKYIAAWEEDGGLDGWPYGSSFVDTYGTGIK